ncbi:MAG TPA: glycosyltransferase [Desulfovibrio sp.]|uniref:glycosyltransferase n=1 Tax=Desulfovibrio sp. TaxID=885 RepID=UPI002D536B8E|nr:glycosyltransferase [Desulfovibrio sp.]HZF60271.1 glycosyltransferase [Desulfovibrio sp.]
MHIGLFTPMLLSPTPGGAERATHELALGLNGHGHQVTLLYTCKFDLSEQKPFYKPQLGIRYERLPLGQESRLFPEAVGLLKKLQMDVLCGFVWDYSGLLAEMFAKYAGIPFIYAERSAPDLVINRFWNARDHAQCVREASGIVLQMESYRKEYPPELQEKIAIIPNSIRPASVIASPGDEGANPKIILAVGKMCESLKNFSALLCAFALLAPRFPDWKLCLCGDGADMDIYKDMASKLGIRDVVLFRGNVQQIGAEYAASHIFCIPSLSEGFPNVLGEAQTHGLPAVGFAACTGVNELIVDGENGFLAPETTEASLALSLMPLMKNAKLRQLMGAKALDNSAKFNGARVYELWEALFQRYIHFHATSK